MSRLSKGAVPKYRKHKASGQALVTIAGRGYYLGPYKSKASLVEYDRLITEWLAAGRSSSFGAPADELTVLQLTVPYLKFAKRRYHRPDRRTDEYGCVCESVKPLKRLYDHTPAVQFGPTAFKAVWMSLINTGLARSTVNGRMARIRRIFKWAAAEELIPASIPQSLSMVEGLRKGETEARESEPVRPVSEADFQAVPPYLPEVVADMVPVPATDRLSAGRGMYPPAVRCGPIGRRVDLPPVGSQDGPPRPRPSHLRRTEGPRHYPPVSSPSR